MLLATVRAIVRTPQTSALHENRRHGDCVVRNSGPYKIAHTANIAHTFANNCAHGQHRE